MKILTQGRPVKKYRKFECKTCGCVFLATKKEYVAGPPAKVNTVFMWEYRCECPNCEETVYVLNTESDEVVAEE